MNPGARYLLVLFGVTGLALGLLLGLNLLLGERALGGPEATRLASAWQQETRGVTYAPPITAVRRFKALRLADRMPGINAVAFGSSTAWGITADALPREYGFYNFAVTGNPLANIIGEIEYLLVAYPGKLRLLVVPMEWAIGSVYDKSVPPVMNLAPAAVLADAEQSAVSLGRKIQDALSYPKVVNLLKALRTIFRGPEPLANARSLFFGLAGEPYRCADGTPARDFDVVNRGQCSGFRDDGSWSFGGEKRLIDRNARLQEPLVRRLVFDRCRRFVPRFVLRIRRDARGDILVVPERKEGHPQRRIRQADRGARIGLVIVVADADAGRNVFRSHSQDGEFRSAEADEMVNRDHRNPRRIEPYLDISCRRAAGGSQSEQHRPRGGHHQARRAIDQRGLGRLA